MVSDELIRVAFTLKDEWYELLSNLLDKFYGNTELNLKETYDLFKKYQDKLNMLEKNKSSMSFHEA